MKIFYTAFGLVAKLFLIIPAIIVLFGAYSENNSVLSWSMLIATVLTAVCFVVFHIIDYYIFKINNFRRNHKTDLKDN